MQIIWRQGVYLPPPEPFMEHHRLAAQSCLFCHPMDYSPPGSSLHGILQARIMEWVTIFFSRGSSRPRGQSCVFCIGRPSFSTTEPPGKPHATYEWAKLNRKTTKAETVGLPESRKHHSDMKINHAIAPGRYPIGLGAGHLAGLLAQVGRQNSTIFFGFFRAKGDTVVRITSQPNLHPGTMTTS